MRASRWSEGCWQWSAVVVRAAGWAGCAGCCWEPEHWAGAPHSGGALRWPQMGLLGGRQERQPLRGEQSPVGDRVRARPGRPGHVRGSGAGLTLAGAETLDRDVQALAAGDGPQLTLVAIGDAIRPADLEHEDEDVLWGAPFPAPPPPTRPTPHLGRVHPRTSGCWAHAVGGASLLHAGRPELTVHVSTGLGCRGVWGREETRWLRRPAARTAAPQHRPGPHLSHSQRGPGRGRLDTARTWARPPPAYRNTARSSAHSRPAQPPGGHSCKLRGQGQEGAPEACAWFPHRP